LKCPSHFRLNDRNPVEKFGDIYFFLKIEIWKKNPQLLKLSQKNINIHIFSKFEKSANYLRRRRAQENSEGNRSHFWLNARI
jgi:hypothetical protein